MLSPLVMSFLINELCQLVVEPDLLSYISKRMYLSLSKYEKRHFGNQQVVLILNKLK